MLETLRLVEELRMEVEVDSCVRLELIGHVLYWETVRSMETNEVGWDRRTSGPVKTFDQ